MTDLNVGNIIRIQGPCYKHTNRLPFYEGCARFGKSCDEIGCWIYDPKDDVECIIEYTIIKQISDDRYELVITDYCFDKDCRFYAHHTAGADISSADLEYAILSL